MFEFLRHALGLCGEGHPSLIMFFVSGGTGAVLFWSYLKNKFKGNEHEHSSDCGCDKTKLKL